MLFETAGIMYVHHGNSLRDIELSVRVYINIYTYIYTYTSYTYITAAVLLSEIFTMVVSIPHCGLTSDASVLPREEFSVCVKGMPVRTVKSMSIATSMVTVEAGMSLKPCAYRLMFPQCNPRKTGSSRRWLYD